MTHSQTESTSAAVMAARRATLQERVATLAALTAEWQKIGNLRLGLFAALVAGGIWWLSSRGMLPSVLSLVLLALFLGVVVWHRSISQRRKRAAILTDIARENVWRLERDWGALPIHHTFQPIPTHPYAADLDLFGRGSLMQLLDTTVTPVG